MEIAEQERFIHDVSDLLYKEGIPITEPMRALIEGAVKKMDGVRYKPPQQVVQDIRSLRYNHLVIPYSRGL